MKDSKNRPSGNIVNSKKAVSSGENDYFAPNKESLKNTEADKKVLSEEPTNEYAKSETITPTNNKNKPL